MAEGIRSRRGARPQGEGETGGLPLISRRVLSGAWSSEFAISCPIKAPHDSSCHISRLSFSVTATGHYDFLRASSRFISSCRGQVCPDMRFFSVSHLTPSLVSTCFVCFGSAFYYVGSVHFSCRGSLSRHSPLVSLWYVMACHVMSRLLLSCGLHACARSIMPCHLVSCLVMSDGCSPPVPVDVASFL